MRAIKPIIAGILLTTSYNIYAAIDGTIGASSTGSFDIMLNILPKIKIFGLTDMDFTDKNLPATITSRPCIATTLFSGLYSLTIKSMNDFNLVGAKQDNKDTIGYSIEYKDQSDKLVFDSSKNKNNETVAMVQGGLPNDRPSMIDTTCSTRDSNAQIDITIGELTENQPADKYTDVVTLIVAAE